MQAEAATAQNKRDIDMKRQAALEEAKRKKDAEDLRIANEAIRARQDELGGPLKKFVKELANLHQVKRVLRIGWSNILWQ